MYKISERFAFGKADRPPELMRGARAALERIKMHFEYV